MMNFKRILAFVLSLCMILTLAPVSTAAFAAENEPAGNAEDLVFEQLSGDDVDVKLPQKDMGDDSLVLERPIADDSPDRYVRYYENVIAELRDIFRE
jgi:hypothetical protein